MRISDSRVVFVCLCAFLLICFLIMVVFLYLYINFPGVEAGLQRLKPHREGLLVPIIQEYRKQSGHTLEASRKQKEDGRVHFITSLLASNSELSDETITAVAIVSVYPRLIIDLLCCQYL